MLFIFLLPKHIRRKRTAVAVAAAAACIGAALVARFLRLVSLIAGHQKIPLQKAE